MRKKENDDKGRLDVEDISSSHAYQLFNFLPSLTSRNTFIDISPVFQVCLFGEGTINFHESSFKFEDYFLNTVTKFCFCLMTFYLLRAFIGDSGMDFSCT